MLNLDETFQNYIHFGQGEQDQMQYSFRMPIEKKKITCIRKEKNVKIRIRNPHAKVNMMLKYPFLIGRK